MREKSSVCAFMCMCVCERERERVSVCIHCFPATTRIQATVFAFVGVCACLEGGGGMCAYMFACVGERECVYVNTLLSFTYIHYVCAYVLVCAGERGTLCSHSVCK